MSSFAWKATLNYAFSRSLIYVVVHVGVGGRGRLSQIPAFIMFIIYDKNVCVCGTLSKKIIMDTIQFFIR